MKAEERWQSRFRAPRATLPVWAVQAPSRSVYRSNASGAWEVYAWDRAGGSARQVTSRPKGTRYGALDPTGQWIWWFDDTDGDEWGRWMRQPFYGGPDEPIDLAPGFPSGIGLSATGEAVVGMARPGRGFTVHLVRPGEPARTIYEHAEAAAVSAVSLDGSLIAISHSEHGDARHPALRVLRRGGQVVGDLYDGPGKGSPACASHRCPETAGCSPCTSAGAAANPSSGIRKPATSGRSGCVTRERSPPTGTATAVRCSSCGATAAAPT